MSAQTDHAARVVAVLAHPDDAELSCFGTLMKYAQAGCRVSVVIVCTGEHGVSVEDKGEAGVDRLSNSLRFQESVRAFEHTGIYVESLLYEDSSFQMDNAFVSNIERRLKELVPSVLITHFVDASGVDHQDHSLVGRACLNIAVRCPSIRRVLLTEPVQSERCGFVPNYYVAINEHFERKVQAVSAHASQVGRFYLTRDYHWQRCYQHGLSAAPSRAGNPCLCEAFVAPYCFED